MTAQPSITCASCGVARLPLSFPGKSTVCGECLDREDDARERRGNAHRDRVLRGGWCRSCGHSFEDHATDAERESTQVTERPCLWARASSICNCEDFTAVLP